MDDKINLILPCDEMEHCYVNRNGKLLECRLTGVTKQALFESISPLDMADWLQNELGWLINKPCLR